jgi:hypothetical protein
MLTKDSKTGPLLALQKDQTTSANLLCAAQGKGQ